MTVAVGSIPRIQLVDNHGPFVAAGKPMMVAMRHDEPTAAIVLMRHDGTVLHGPLSLVPEQKINLLEAMPSINTLDEAAYLQLLHGEQPINTALVIEPALSRRVPLVEQVETPGRGTWTKIVGWQDEGAEDREDLPADAGRINGAALSEPAPRDASVVRSGWWIYPERDVRAKTDHGEMWIDLREDTAPGTCRSFRALAGMGFFNDTIVHRVVPVGRNGRPFVIQGGDPTGTGEGGPGWWTPLEPSFLPHDYGVLSMARADHPDSAGSQWFIALDREETARLDGQYCAFGEVILGEDTIDSMAAVELADTDYLSSRPVKPPVIELMRIAPATPRTPGTGRKETRVKPPDSRDPATSEPVQPKSDSNEAP
ncbi:MAG: peptidylprolyl isomerase [Phycisphaerales bacterium]|nr:peptidylprolyl isomerase [Phycisphaerales bacterium]